ncbi:MAG TPA: glycosyltransferase family 4 protein [Myxococcota bacterium]|nr:glycosyltransferase family 4 protein [Myxococcota bacterium]
MPTMTGVADRVPVRLGIFVTHPIQYFAPLWRSLAATHGLDLKVHFFSDHSVRGGIDPGFGVSVAWDVPVLEGYPHEFITRDAPWQKPGRVSLPDVRNRIRREHFDAVLVHGYSARFERQVLRIARAAGVRTLLRGEFAEVIPFDGRSAWKSVLRTIYLRRLYSRIDAFCHLGEEGRIHLVRHGVPGDKMFFSPYAVDTELFEKQVCSLDRAQCRQELGIEEDQVVLLFSGKLIPKKAPLLLVEALRRLPRLEKVVLLVVGDGEQRAQVERDARAVLGDRLLMPGFVNQSAIGRYYASADIFVMPSHYETWGLVVNEAMQFSLPVVVSTSVACHRDLVVGDETGMVFHDGDVESLARGLARFIGDPSLRRQAGEQARKRIAAYSIEASAAGIRRALGL